MALLRNTLFANISVKIAFLNLRKFILKNFLHLKHGELYTRLGIQKNI